MDLSIKEIRSACICSTYVSIVIHTDGVESSSDAPIVITATIAIENDIAKEEQTSPPWNKLIAFVLLLEVIRQMKIQRQATCSILHLNIW